MPIQVLKDLATKGGRVKKATVSETSIYLEEVLDPGAGKKNPWCTERGNRE
jgi:hypothetical protein